MVCGLVATFCGVTVDVQVEAVLVLVVSVHAPVILSVASEEVTATVPNGLKDGLYSSASDAGLAAVVKPTTSTWPLFSSVETSPLSDCCRLPVVLNLSLSASYR